MSSALGLILTLSLAGVPVIAGDAVVYYRLDEPLTLPSYSNNGFQQQGGPGRASVHVSLRPDFTRAPFPVRTSDGPALAALAAAGEAPPQVVQLARAATAGANDQEEAVLRVLEAIRARVRYERDAFGTEEPLAALEAGRGYCVGLANLALSALTAAGVPARSVHGLLVDGEGRQQAHRWIEVYYPDAGWVFSDATASANFVDARHIVLRPPGVSEPGYDPAPFVLASLGVTGRDGALLAVDSSPRGEVLMRRRNRPVQWSTTVAGYVKGGWPGLAVRLSGERSQFLTSLDGNLSFSFTALEPGRYTLSVGDAGDRRLVAPLELEAAGLKTLSLNVSGR